jgi:hypothetical protein
LGLPAPEPLNACSCAPGWENIRNTAGALPRNWFGAGIHGVGNLTHRHASASKQLQRVSHAAFRAIVEYRDAELCLEGTLEL